MTLHSNDMKLVVKNHSNYLLESLLCRLLPPLYVDHQLSIISIAIEIAIGDQYKIRKRVALSARWGFMIIKK